MTRPVPLAVAAAVREVAEPVVREHGLKPLDRKLGRSIGGTNSAISQDYSPSLEWWIESLVGCGRGFAFEISPTGEILRTEVTGDRSATGVAPTLPLDSVAVGD